MADVFIKVVFQKFTERYEVLYIGLIVVFPITCNWIPFINLAYGTAGAFCWIRDREYENCDHFYFGIYLRFFLFYLPWFAVMFTNSILLIISVCMIRRKHKLSIGQDYNTIQVQKKIENEIKPLIAYPIIFIVIMVVPFIQRIYGIFNNEDNWYYFLSIMLLLVFRLTGVFITIAFTLDAETRKKLNCVEIKAAVKRWIGKEEKLITNYNVELCHSDSLRIEEGDHKPDIGTVSSTPYFTID
jgi:hypothetical protein